ncbi:MAG TPA: GAF domain-containing protein [Solirubrobacteraceae bacterium]|jgi:GAF domain-containing protein
MSAAGVGSGGLDDEAGRRFLLQSIAELTRAVFGARACSIMRSDPATQELVFEAVVGEGAGTLVGQRISARTGLAGWALASEEPIAVSDVRRDPRFARDVAEDTGYVPTAISVYPLLHGERSIGVLNVLDQGASERVGLADMEVLGRIATHAAAVLALVEDARRADAGEDQFSRLQGRLNSASPRRRAAAADALDALRRLLED